MVFVFDNYIYVPLLSKTDGSNLVLLFNKVYIGSIEENKSWNTKFKEIILMLFYDQVLLNYPTVKVR